MINSIEFLNVRLELYAIKYGLAGISTDVYSISDPKNGLADDFTNEVN